MTASGYRTQRDFLPDLCTAHSVLVVVVVAELMAVVQALMASYDSHFSLPHLALSSLFMQWIGLSSAALLCSLRSWLNRLPAGLAALLVVVVVALNTLAFSLLGQMLVSWARGLPVLFNVWSHNVLVNVLIALIVAGMIMRYFYIQDELRYKGEAELRARIQALQSRIRPHFLFNSMNIIASLISVDPEAAEQVVDDLARLFRASLKETGEQVTLEQELELCRRYVHIEQLRIGDRLKMNWQVEAGVGEALIPLLTLQPLLENAVYYGVQPNPEGGEITVAARLEQDRVQISISNPLARQSRHQGNRMAQENIRHRLEALYGNQARLEVQSTDTQYRVLISYPDKKDNNKR